MVTQVDFLQNTFGKVTGGYVGEQAPEIFVASSQQTHSVLITAGAIADMVTSKLVKVKDIIWVNGDLDGTPFQDVYTVTSTSGGSLITYPNSVGGALLAANNLSDVSNAVTARTNLGIGLLSAPQFASLVLTSLLYKSSTTAITAHAGGGQASAVALTTDMNVVSVVATAADSVKLPASTGGMSIWVTNSASNSCNVFPASGEAINALGANTAFALAGAKTAIFSCCAIGQWYSLLTA